MIRSLQAQGRGASRHDGGGRSASGRAAPALVPVLAAIPLLVSVCSRAPEEPGPSNAEEAARAEARDFLARYVDASGRVVRHDQGGDTVSEGQSYALLLAQVVGDEEAFRRVWLWTRLHLQQPDGLLASHADSERVLDPNPASDADLVTAWALTRATGTDAGAYGREGRRIARAVLERETVAGPGPTLLAAGPWATGTPATLNPSYWALGAFEDLGEETGDRRWRKLAAASVSTTGTLSEGGRLLPPDWARVDGATVSAAPSPNGDVPQVQYGPDAQRLVVWLAASCDPAARRLAAAWHPKLSSPGSAQALALGIDGEVLNGMPSPLSLVAAAAAAGAAGLPSERDRLLAEADRLDTAQPSYYGAAWVALGRALLTTDMLGGCALNGGGT
jgi:endoglucanase